MDAFRPQKSPNSDRFLDLFSSSPPSSASSSSFELDEQDIFSSDSDPNPNANPRPSPTPSPALIHSHYLLNHNPSPSRSSPLSPFRNFGILAALPEDSGDPKFLQRKPSISSASTSPTAARMIPVIPKPKAPVSRHHQYQSAPVNVPVGPRRGMRGGPQVEEEDGEDEDEMMLPPHEIVDRAQGKGEPVTTFSVLEGVGRTLKGRDLRRVRNAVWHKTVAEPPTLVMSTILSLMAYDYPPEKLNLYLSDDGGSIFTFYAVWEISHFAKHRLPYCRKFSVVPRSPDAYFSKTCIRTDEFTCNSNQYSSIKV